MRIWPTTVPLLLVLAAGCDLRPGGKPTAGDRGAVAAAGAPGAAPVARVPGAGCKATLAVEGMT